MLSLVLIAAGIDNKNINRLTGYGESTIRKLKLFSKAIRKHWSVEIMHWHLDVTFKEDANKTLDKDAAQNMNIIRKWALSILKTVDFGKNNRLN